MLGMKELTTFVWYRVVEELITEFGRLFIFRRSDDVRVNPPQVAP